MSDITKLAANANRLSSFSCTIKSNTPSIITDRQKTFFTVQTQAYALENGAIADNVYDAMCQGLNASESEDEDFDPTQCTIIGTTLYLPLFTKGSIVNRTLAINDSLRKNEKWYKYTPVRIRANPASIATTGELMPDDWLRIHILAPAGYTYIPPGAYIVFGGNTWIVYKSYNISVGLGQAIVRRCNAVIKKLDYYGNIIEVPISYSKMGTLGNAAHTTENSIIAKNYISCICQLNETSKDFRENTRLLLGNTAYAMRGVNNFTREFTDTEGSAHQITFTIELTEDLPQDDFENGVADGLSFSWNITLQVSPTMTVGSTQTIVPTSLRKGKITVSTEFYPIEYIYTSSDAETLSVDKNGLVTAIKAGAAEITVSLAENPSVFATTTIIVGSTTSGIEFTKTTNNIKRFQSAEVSASLFENNIQSQQELKFYFSGAETDCYSAAQIGTNTYSITCYALATHPLIVTASYGSYSKSISIDLTE